MLQTLWLQLNAETKTTKAQQNSKSSGLSYNEVILPTPNTASNGAQDFAH